MHGVRDDNLKSLNRSGYVSELMALCTLSTASMSIFSFELPLCCLIVFRLIGRTNPARTFQHMHVKLTRKQVLGSSRFLS